MRPLPAWRPERGYWPATHAATIVTWSAVLLGTAHGLAYLRLAMRSVLPPGVYGKDFLQDYVLARAVAEGTDPYVPMQLLAARYTSAPPGSVDLALPTPHPPPVGLLLLPLAQFDYGTAAKLWLVTELVLLVWAVVCVARAAGARLPWWGELVIAAALVGWYPFYWDLIFGQLMVLLLALLAGAWLALRSGRSVLGGVLVGLAVLVKLIPWPLFLLLVLRRDWRALGASIATALLGYAATGWAMGPDRLLAYFTRVAPDVGHMYEASAVNLSLWAPGRRLFEGTPRGEYAGMDITAPPLVESPLAAMVISVAVPALVLAGACFWARNQRGLGPSLGVMVCVVVLVSPIAWPHYFVLAVIPATQVINWLVRHRLPKRETIAALVLGSLLLLPSEHWQLLAHLAAGQLPVQGQTSVLPVTPALLTLGPACALAGLAWLLAVLAAREQGWGEPASAVRRLTR